MPMPMRLRPYLLSLLLLLTGAPSAPAQTHDGYEAALASVVDEVAAALADRPEASVVVPPLRRTDGSVPELGALVADDLLIYLSRSPRLVTACDRTGFEEIFHELELERKGLIQPAAVHELGNFCSADILLLGTLFDEGEGAIVRLKLVDTETAEALTGDRFRLPLSRAEQETLARRLTPDPPAPSSTRSKRDDGVPQDDRVGDFTLTLRECKFIEHDGLFCHLEAKNHQLVDSRLTVLGTSSLLVDNQGAEYHAMAFIESGDAEPISFRSSPDPTLHVPATMMRSFKLHFRVSRREQKAQGLVIHTPAGAARFGSFFFARDRL